MIHLHHYNYKKFFALSPKEEDIYLKKILDISRYIHDQIENLVIMKKYSSKSLEYTGILAKCIYYLDKGLMTQCYILGYNWSEAQVTLPDMMWHNNIIITEIRTFLLISNLQFVLTIDWVQIIIGYGSDHHMFDMLPHICGRS